jgi:hypothetical protein
MKIDSSMKRYYKTVRPILLQILEEAAEEDRLRVRQGLTINEVLMRQDMQETMLENIVPEILDAAFGFKEEEKQ